jgi:hypothetical protein
MAILDGSILAAYWAAKTTAARALSVFAWLGAWYAECEDVLQRQSNMSQVETVEALRSLKGYALGVKGACGTHHGSG